MEQELPPTVEKVNQNVCDCDFEITNFFFVMRE